MKRNETKLYQIRIFLALCGHFLLIWKEHTGTEMHRFHPGSLQSHSNQQLSLELSGPLMVVAKSLDACV